MATITIKNKNKTPYTLSKNYDSNVMYSNSVTDIKFNQDLNILQEGLQIRITQLPDKGVLYCNPVGSVGIPVVVNDIITSTQLSNNFLQFKAEGNSNNAFTGNYSTSFKYVVLNGSGVQVGDEVTVTINMTDIPSASISIVNRVVNPNDGTGTFHLVVTGAPFVGYAIAKMTNSSYNDNQKVASVSVHTVHLTPKINSSEPTGSVDVVSVPVNIPVGTYNNGEIFVSSAAPFTEDVYCDATLTFSLTDVYEDGIVAATIMVPLDRPGVPA